MEWSKILEYRNGKLYWKIKPSKKVAAGSVAGTLLKSGYRHFKYGGRNYYEARVIWEMKHGPIPKGKEIDHISHNRSDNRYENLRLVAKQDNQKNMKLNKRNKTGHMGVYFDKFSNKWVARIGVNGTIKTLGYSKDKTRAVELRKAAEKKYGYHENHGRKL